MQLIELDEYIRELRDGGRNDKKDTIRTIVDVHEKEAWAPVVRYLSGEVASDSGVGKKTVIECYGNASIPVSTQEFEDLVGKNGTVTEAGKQVFSETGQVMAEQFTKDITIESVEDLHNELNYVLNSSGNKQKRELTRLLSETDRHYLVAFALLNDWKTGVTSTTIANAMGEKAGAEKEEIERARALEPDPVVFVDMCQLGYFEDMLNVVPGIPFEPMKAKSESHLGSMLEESAAIYAEPKLDGYRCIIHVTDMGVDAYTRKMKPLTESLPELQDIEWPDGEYVLDCEVMASDGSFNTTSEMVGSNQERDLGDHNEHVKFHLFDILYDSTMPKQDVSKKTYEKRRAGLTLLMRRLQDSDYVEMVRAFGFADTKDPLQDAVQYARDNDLEGVIVKNGLEEYKFGKRSKAWCKKKITETTVDLEIGGFKPGEGDNAGSLGAVELYTSEGTYVGNVGNGFTDEERDEIWENRSEYEGVVVEVTGEGLGSNNEIRFPRVERLRTEDGEADRFYRVKELMEDV